MEKRQSGINAEQKLNALLKKYSGVSSIKRDDDLEWDVGLTGDDAVEFIVEYGTMFNVNVDKFNFHTYFYDEGQNIILLFRRIFRRYKKEKFTLSNLLLGIEKGKLE